MGGRKKNNEQNDDDNGMDDSEDEVFKPKSTTRSQKQKRVSDSSQNKSQSSRRSSKAKAEEPPAEEPPAEAEEIKQKEPTAPPRQEFCPICQVPLSILKITPANHTANCNVPANLPACSEGSNCLNTNIFHYRDYSHHTLAAFRVSEDYVEPDIIFTPHKAKLKRTPMRSSGKKRPSQSPVASASKICRTDEPIGSPDIFLESQTIPSKSCGVEETKKRLSFNKDQNESEDPDDPQIIEKLHETDVFFSDLILSEEPQPLPLELFSHEPIPIKREPPSPSSANETGTTKVAAPNAKVIIDYNHDSISDCDQDIVGNKMECNHRCQKIENEESLQANCSVVFKAHGISREEAMSRSPVSINLLLNSSGWEAVEIKSTLSTNLQKIKVSLCKCSSSVCIDCSLSNRRANGDVNSIENDHQQHEKMFLSMVELGLKDQPLNGDTLNKENYLANCNQIKISSVAQNECVSKETDEDLVLREVTSDKVGTIKVKDAFSLLKRTSADGGRKSAISAAPLSGLNSRPATPTGVPMVVSKSTSSSWTLIPSKENKTKSSSMWAPATGNKKVPGYKRIPDTSFVVDAFSYGVIPGIKIYFLSHFHSDHYGGLRKDFSMPIFCSQVTANLVHLKLRVDKKYLHVLKMDEPRMVCGVEVEIFDANHCPGAIMILFRLADGRVFLHVGDFRAHASMEEIPQLRQVDKLYLDTTYLDPSYNFPSQEEVVEKVIKTVREHLSQNKSTLIVSGTYTIGKEKVFMGIANAFNMKIWTAPEKRRVLLSLEDQNIFDRLTNDPFEAQIHVLAMREVSFEVLSKYLSKYSTKYSSILGFKPTGWTTSKTIKGKPSDFQKTIRGKVTIYGVPYSEHSSFSELRQFVRFVRPKDIQVTVNVSKSNEYKKLFQQWLSTSRDVDNQSKMNKYFSSSK